MQAEENEDAWWAAHLQRCHNAHRGPHVRPHGALSYKRRALDAVVEASRDVFRHNHLGLLDEDDSHNASHHANDRPRRRVPNLDVANILEWIDNRRMENDTVRRFVMPCVPPSFALAHLYEEELHLQFMRLVTTLLYLVHPDGCMVLSESDLIQLTAWYSRCKEQVAFHDEAIDSFLTDVDRQRLITALQKHCSDRITAQIKAALASQRTMEASRWTRPRRLCQRRIPAPAAMSAAGGPDGSAGCCDGLRQ